MIPGLGPAKAAGGIVAALPGWLKGAAIVAVSGFIFYEGVSIPLPFLPDIDIIDGRVDRVVERRIAASREEARRIDRDADDFAAERAIAEEREQSLWREKASATIQEYREELAARGDAGSCAATPADVERLR